MACGSLHHGAVNLGLRLAKAAAGSPTAVAPAPHASRIDASVGGRRSFLRGLVEPPLAAGSSSLRSLLARQLGVRQGAAKVPPHMGRGSQRSKAQRLGTSPSRQRCSHAPAEEHRPVGSASGQALQCAEQSLCAVASARASSAKDESTYGHRTKSSRLPHSRGSMVTRAASPKLPEAAQLAPYQTHGGPRTT